MDIDTTIGLFLFAVRRRIRRWFLARIMAKRRAARMARRARPKLVWSVAKADGVIPTGWQMVPTADLASNAMHNAAQQMAARQDAAYLQSNIVVGNHSPWQGSKMIFVGDSLGNRGYLNPSPE